MLRGLSSSVYSACHLLCVLELFSYVTSVVSNSVRPHRWQATRLHRSWDSPGKNTGVGCHFLLRCSGASHLINLSNFLIGKCRNRATWYLKDMSVFKILCIWVLRKYLNWLFSSTKYFHFIGYRTFSHQLSFIYLFFLIKNFFPVFFVVLFF